MENSTNTSSSPPQVGAPKLLGAVSPQSPRSDSVEKALRRHRKALEEIRAANSNLADTVPALNLNSKLDRVVFQSAEKTAADQDAAKPTQAASCGEPWTNAVGRLLTWQNPAGTCPGDTLRHSTTPYDALGDDALGDDTLRRSRRRHSTR